MTNVVIDARMPWKSRCDRAGRAVVLDSVRRRMLGALFAICVVAPLIGEGAQARAAVVMGGSSSKPAPRPPGAPTVGGGPESGTTGGGGGARSMRVP